MKKLDIIILSVFVIAVIVLMVIGACKKDIIIGLIALVIAAVSLIIFLKQRSSNKNIEANE